MREPDNFEEEEVEEKRDSMKKSSKGRTRNRERRTRIGGARREENGRGQERFCVRKLLGVS